MGTGTEHEPMGAGAAPRATRPARRLGEDGKVKIMFFPGCLVVSLVLSIGGTILVNLLLRAFD